jgi:hypothetical protein
MTNALFENAEDSSQNSMSNLDQLVEDTNRQIAETPSFFGRVKIITSYSVSLSIFAGKQILNQPMQLLGASGNILQHTVKWMTENPLRGVALSALIQGTMGQIACTNAAGSWDSACKIDSTYFTTPNDAALRQMYNTACSSFTPSNWCQNNIYPDVTSLGGPALGQVTNAAVGIDYNVNLRCIVNPPTWLVVNQTGRDICFGSLPASALTPTPTPTSLPPSAYSPSDSSSILPPPSSSMTGSPSTGSSSAFNSNTGNPSTSTASAQMPSSQQTDSSPGNSSHETSVSSTTSSSPRDTSGSQNGISSPTTRSASGTSVSSSTTNPAISVTLIIGTPQPVYSTSGIEIATYLIEQEGGMQTLTITLNGDYQPADGELVTLFTYASDFGSFDQIIVTGYDQCYYFEEQPATETSVTKSYQGIFILESSCTSLNNAMKYGALAAHLYS